MRRKTPMEMVFELLGGPADGETITLDDEATEFIIPHSGADNLFHLYTANEYEVCKMRYIGAIVSLPTF